jgi:hypothetical protein
MPKANDLTHEILFYPAYDHRDKDKGQHCVDILWLVRGPLGVIQFRLFTGWSARVIGKPDLEWQALSLSRARYSDADAVWPPMPADIGYHSPRPMYEDQSLMDCDLLPEGKCYYDGSTLNADRYFAIFIHEGGEALWKALDEYYHERFEAAEAVTL